MKTQPVTPRRAANAQSRSTRELRVEIARLGVISAAALIALIQLRRSQEWNRRKATWDAIREDFSSPDVFRDFGTKYQLNFNSNQPSRSFDDVLGSYTTPEQQLQFYSDVKALLNKLELAAVGMKYNVLDEHMTMDVMIVRMVRYWDWAKPHIEYARQASPLIYVDQEHYVKKWRPTLEGASIPSRWPGKRKT